MTITYTAQVATCKHLGCFWKLLFRWKGSIYKLLWMNMLLYIVLFMAVKFAYLYLMSEDLQKTMVTIGQYCHAFEETIPLSFLLGFYVAIVITRWWEQYLSIPWPDSLAVLVSVFITGQDVRGRVMRRTIMRYANLSLVMTFTMVSPFIKRRFPNYQSFVDAGLMLPSEHQRFKVASWAVYSYFGTTIVSYQFPLNNTSMENEKVVMSIPIFPMLQFFFYMGWLLVAETLANPFGEDDDDFDIGWLIDRNLQVSYCIADEMHNTHPELLKDQYWDDVLPPDLPWNPHTDLDDPEDPQNLSKRSVTKSGIDRNKKGSKWRFDTETPVNFAKADFISRSLDLGSERVIRVYLPPSMSRITFGSRTTNRSGLSKGSRPSGDSKLDYIPPKDMVNDIRTTEARTRVFHDVVTDKEDVGPQFAAPPFDNSESRLEDETEVDGSSFSDTKFDSSIMPNNNFIYRNQIREPNELIDNQSSWNLFSINNNSSRVETISSFGLNRLLSENIIKKAIEKNDHKRKYDNSDESSSCYEDSIVIKETAKVSKIEKISRQSRLQNFQSISMRTNEQDEPVDEMSFQEKSIRSGDKIVSLPVGFGEDISEFGDIAKGFLINENNVNPTETIAYMQRQSEHYCTLPHDPKISMSAYTSKDQSELSDSRHCAESSKCQNSRRSSLCGSRESFCATDFQAVSDMLFDRILEQEIARSNQDSQKPFESNKDIATGNLNEEAKTLGEFSKRNLHLGVEYDKSQFIEQSKTKVGQKQELLTPSNESDVELNLSITEDLSENDRMIFKSASEEFYEAAMEESIDPEEQKELTCDKDSCIFEVFDQQSCNIISECYDVCEDASKINENQTIASINARQSDAQEAHTIFKGNSQYIKQAESCQPNQSSSAVSISTADVSSLVEVVSNPENLFEDMNEFRDKVNQSVCLRQMTLSSQPKISSLYHHPSTLSTLIELPEDSDVERES